MIPKLKYFNFVSLNENMTAPVLQYISPEEYLIQERAAEYKHEYFKGEIVAMASASLAHNTIVSNIIRRIGNILDGTPCRVFPSDLRVSVSSEQSFTYPDATIVCDDPEMLDDKFDTLKNPSVIFEVISPSTENNDRGRKFFFYMQIPSFKEYILINSTNIYVQAGRRQADDSWKFEDIKDISAALFISTIGHKIPLQEIYSNANLNASP